jgi:hypothetical protein
MVAKLLTLPVASTANRSADFETRARLRFKVLLRSCFPTLESCALYLKADPKSVSRWRRGARKIPGWVLMALEHRASEIGVTIANITKEAA